MIMKGDLRAKPSHVLIVYENYLPSMYLLSMSKMNYNANGKLTT